MTYDEAVAHFRACLESVRNPYLDAGDQNTIAAMRAIVDDVDRGQAALNELVEKIRRDDPELYARAVAQAEREAA